MSVQVGTDGRGLRTLLRDLASEGIGVARGQVRLTALEIGGLTRQMAGGAAQVALGVVLIVLGALALLTALVLLIGDQWLAADRYWLAALIVLVITAVVAALFARRGLALVSPSGLAPTETVSTLKEDSAWLKRRLTSGGTSS